MEKHQNEALKAWLRQYQELRRDADRLFDRLEDLRGRAEGARTAHLDGLPHGSRNDADRIGADLSRLEDLEQEAREAQQEAITARRKISAAIKQIHGPRWADRREILRLRYLDGLRWEDVAERLFGDSQDFWDNMEKYLRRCFKLHNEALTELQEIVPLPAGQEKENTA